MQPRKRREISAGKSGVGVREEGLNCNAIEKQFVKLVHMHTGLESPSAHIISSLLVTSAKTKRSRMLQMYHVGGIIKSNSSQSQLYLAKDTELHAFMVCLRPDACVRQDCPISRATLHIEKNSSLNTLRLLKSGKTIIEGVIKVLAGQVQL